MIMLHNYRCGHPCRAPAACQRTVARLVQQADKVKLLNGTSGDRCIVVGFWISYMNMMFRGIVFRGPDALPGFETASMSVQGCKIQSDLKWCLQPTHDLGPYQDGGGLQACVHTCMPGV